MSKSIVIGIAGGTASGKTTFVKQLKQRLGHDQICVLSQDNYYRTRDQVPRDANGRFNFDVPEALDFASMRNDLASLLLGQGVVQREYDFNLGSQEAKQIQLTPSPVILVEGVLVFCDSLLFNMFDYKVFLDVDMGNMLSRRINRDCVERGYDLEQTLYMWQNHVSPSYINLIKPKACLADFIINGDHSIEKSLRFFEGFLNNYRSSVG